MVLPGGNEQIRSESKSARGRRRKVVGSWKRLEYWMTPERKKRRWQSWGVDEEGKSAKPGSY